MSMNTHSNMVKTDADVAPLSHPSASLKRLPFPLDYASNDVRPYLELIRLDKPTGTWLVFWPYAWGLTMAAYHTSISVQRYAVELAVAFLVAFIMRSFACTVNDICDYEFDKGVERTKGRPLASGRISYISACVYAFVQMVIALGVFYLSLNTLGFAAAAIQLLPLSCLYPLMKRITFWPQAWLGIAINFGAVISWLSITDEMNYTIMATLLLSLWSWTILYDTIYACQDKVDDLKVGVRSTAILFGSYIRVLLTGFGVVYAIALAYAGHLNGQGPLFYAVSVGGTIAHLIWQYFTVDLDNPTSCKVNFVRNGQLGWIVTGGLLLDYLHKTSGGFDFLA